MTQQNQLQIRFQRVLEYIDANLERDLTVEELSHVCAYSKFHFHRQFSSFFGVGVSKFILLKRLKRASHQLAYRQTAIGDIAYDCCFESPEAFSRAFKKHFAQTPSDFRSEPACVFWQTNFEPETKARITKMTDKYSLNDIEVVEFPETRIAVLEHHGDPNDVPNSVRKFISWRKENGLPPSQSATFNLLYNNPNEVAQADYRLDICAELKSKLRPNDASIVEKTIPAGACVKLRYTGSYDFLEEAVSYVYATWLPQSDREPRDFPLFLQRVSFFPDVPEHEAITDIYVPIK